MTAALAQVDQIRGPKLETGAQGLDLCPFLISIYTRTWSSGERGSGSYSDSITTLPAWTKVKKLSEREIAQSGGRYRTGDMVVWHVRPPYTDIITGKPGGFTQAQLDPTILDDGVEVFYRLTEQYANQAGEAGDYELVELDRSHPMHFDVVIRRRSMPASDPQPPYET